VEQIHKETDLLKVFQPQITRNVPPLSSQMGHQINVARTPQQQQQSPIQKGLPLTQIHLHQYQYR
jgi:hypothetical protein